MGFYLVLEQKLLGLIQFRFGPYKVFYFGIFQFLFDRLKLLFKE